MGQALNIVFVSTWGTHCGLATYCLDLSNALKALGHNIYVLSEAFDMFSTYNSPTDIQNFPCWSRRGSLETIYRVLKSSPVRPHIVHFNHELGLFPKTEDFITVSQRLADDGFKQVVTYHTVSPEYDFSRVAATPIVHTIGAALLCPRSIIIPHGITFRRKDPTEILEAKKALNLLPNKYTALIPGFVVENKRTLEIALSILQNTDHNIIISGEIKDEHYGEWLLARLNASGRQNRLKLDLIYADDKTRDTYFKAADYVVLGRKGPGFDNKGTPHSASGQMATAIGYGLPIFAQYSQIHLDHDGAALLYFNEDELSKLLQGLNDNILRDMSNKCNLSRRDWKQVAEMYEVVYES